MEVLVYVDRRIFRLFVAKSKRWSDLFLLSSPKDNSFVVDCRVFLNWNLISLSAEKDNLMYVWKILLKNKYSKVEMGENGEREDNGRLRQKIQ